ncbi:MAG: universal stress protein [Candidatus Solibacter usitatus]|nr:universal stress protein [Candidatus Solibacter usitatus]
MFTLKKVLFPVDFSDRCRGAARLLEALHTNFEPEITLVHVLPPPHLEYTMTDLGGGLIQDYTVARLGQVRKDLNYFLDDELKHFPIKRVLLEGDPGRKLIDYAHTDGSNLVVMPTHGYGGFRRFMLGSVTAKVLHDADCPVLTGVHMEAIPDPADVHVRTVAAALDLSESSEKVLDYAAGFAEACNAKLLIIHVTPSIEGMTGEYFEPNWRERFEAEALRRISALQQKAGTMANTVMDYGDVGAGVSHMAKENDVGILVIGRGSSSGVFGRIRAHAYGIIRQSPCPVISV